VLPCPTRAVFHQVFGYSFGDLVASAELTESTLKNFYLLREALIGSSSSIIGPVIQFVEHVSSSVDSSRDALEEMQRQNSSFDPYVLEVIIPLSRPMFTEFDQFIANAQGSVQRAETLAEAPERRNVVSIAFSGTTNPSTVRGLQKNITTSRVHAVPERIDTSRGPIRW
jgi:hypothetical protein